MVCVPGSWAAPFPLGQKHCQRFAAIIGAHVIAAIITFAILLGAYALVMWLTSEGGPADIMKFWDEGE